MVPTMADTLVQQWIHPKIINTLCKDVMQSGFQNSYCITKDIS